MSDSSVAKALRSSARLVVVEAPAGCGKTFQGAGYAQEIADKMTNGRVLILAHTHAACDVFACRTRKMAQRVSICTIDSLICQIAAAYHSSLGLPSDIGSWVRKQKEEGFAILAAQVARLLRASPIIPESLARRYPVIICDEHQDASADQHSVALACYEAGASLRVFGDPMQRIYGSKKKGFVEEDKRRWEELKKKADIFDKLDEPHRWANGSESLGHWILDSREILSAGGQVDLRGNLPPGVSKLFAENMLAEQKRGYLVVEEDRKPIYHLVKSKKSLLVLSAHNNSTESMRAFFGRRIPIWEGHVRDNLTALVAAVQEHRGDAVEITRAILDFLNCVATGFSLSDYGKILLDEVSRGCVCERRGKSSTLQSLGTIILNQPDHRGVASLLDQLSRLRETDPAFKKVKIDYCREFWDAVKLGRYDDPEDGLTEISKFRSSARCLLPAKAISTVHKAKGFECDNVLVIPCDAKHFGNSSAARCLLYVAMSRARCSLTFVVSRKQPSPLIVF